MATTGFEWLYLIIFLIPVARILPRVIKKWKTQKIKSNQYDDTKFRASDMKTESILESFKSSNNEEPRQKSLDMLVLGELNHGTKNFDAIQKKLEINNETLNSILEDLETKGLMRVEKKQGLFGLKVELYPTEEGIKKYYS